MGRINPYHKATQKPCFLKFQQKEDQDRGSSVQKQEEDDSNQDHSGHDNFLPTQNFVFPKRVVENDQNQETPRRRFTEYEKRMRKLYRGRKETNYLTTDKMRKL